MGREVDDGMVKSKERELGGLELKTETCASLRTGGRKVDTRVEGCMADESGRRANGRQLWAAPLRGGGRPT